MEPFKALVLLAATAIVSFVGAGAAGFYAGYSAGRGNLDEMKAYLTSASFIIPSGEGGAVSLKPVLDDLEKLSKEVEALSQTKANGADGDSAAKLLMEIKGFSSQIEGLRQSVSKPVASAAPAERPGSAPMPDYTEALQELRELVRALGAKQEPKASKALADDIRGLSAAIQAQGPDLRRTLGEEVRAAIASLQNAEPKAPKALLDEVRALSASIQAQEPALRRAVVEETRTAVTASNIRLADPRPQTPQASLVDQIKVLQASIAKLSDERGHSDSDASAEVAELRQLVGSARSEFARCQTQLASFAGAGPAAVAPQSQPPASTAAAITVSQERRPDAAAVVFYDNVMLKKDQEKQYDEIGVRLALQVIGPKQVHLAVNRQPFGLSFGERKVFRSQDVECEVNLMETNLKESQARLSISCRR